MPFHLGIGIRSLYYFKYIGELGAARKVRYCIECKSENCVKNMEKVETSGAGSGIITCFLVESIRAEHL